MIPQIRPAYRITAIAITVFLIIVCCFISHKDFKQPPPLPKASESLRTYVNTHLSIRSAMMLNGSDVLAWFNGHATGVCSVLAQHYTLLVEGSDTVDGVECMSMRLKPNLKLRPWIQFWIDPKTGRVCSAREWSAENQRKPVGIRFSAAKPSSDVALSPVLDKRILQSLPEGYRLIGYLSQNPAMRHYVYSDGLQVMSIVVGQASAFPKLRLNAVFEQGNTRILAMENNGCIVLCMADISALVLKQWSQEFVTRQ